MHLISSAAAAFLATAVLAPAPASAETVLGVYIFHRHGDRTPKSLPPTKLTPLGADEVYSSGAYFRSLYVAANGTSRIPALAPEVVVNSQLSVTSPVDAVLQNSAQVFLQGLYPPTSAAAETLADGSVAQSPLGGYQYIPISAVNTAATASGAEDNTWLQSSSGCPKAVVSSNGYLSSAEYLGTLQSTRGFYQGLLPAINRTFTSSDANFKNAYTIYDLLNVAEIHNATFGGKDLLTADVLHQLATRADQHEWGLAYNASEPVRSIAGAVLAGQVVQALNATLSARASSASATRLNVQFGAYATFSAFFGLARMHELGADFTGVVGYASSAAFELVTNSSSAADAAAVSPDDVYVRFRFANGTASAAANPLRAYPLFGLGQTLLPWSTFASEMAKIAVSDTAEWCTVCGSTTGTCAAYANGTSSSSDGGFSAASASGNNGGVSKPVAGVIGALVTLVVVLGVQALVMAVAGLRVVKKSAARTVEDADSGKKATA